MQKLFPILFIIVLTSCSTTEKGVAAIDRPDYTPFIKSETQTTVNGKYVECTMNDSTVRTFHIGNGKISRIASSWGNAPAGQTNYAGIRGQLDLISEDEDWIEFGESKFHCGQPLLGLQESVYKVRRFDGWISETLYEASDRTYGSNSEGLMTYRSIGDNQCKLFNKEVTFGACRIFDAVPDVNEFLEPYKPKGL
jgi:hypothetical protein